MEIRYEKIHDSGVLGIRKRFNWDSYLILQYQHVLYDLAINAQYRSTTSTLHPPPPSGAKKKKRIFLVQYC